MTFNTHIARLRHRIAIQTYIEEPSGTSQTAKTWTTVATVWAYIEPQKGGTYFKDKQIKEDRTHKFIIRYTRNIDITSEHWVLFQGRRFRIRAVTNILEYRRYIELSCEEDSKALDYFEVGDEAVGDSLVDLIS